MNAEIRPYTSGDEDGLIRLLNAEFSSQITYEEWDWKYLRNPAGDPITVIAEYGETIVGHLSTIPVWMTVHGRRLLGVQWVDFAMDAELRKTLAGAKIIMKMCRFWQKQTACRSDIGIGYGYPSPHFVSFSLAYWGYKTILPAPQLVKIVNSAYVLDRVLSRIHIHSRNDRGLCFQFRDFFRKRVTEAHHDDEAGRIHIFDSRFDELWYKASKTWNIAIIRDSSYLNWRYAPKRYTSLFMESHGEVTGFSVTRIISWNGWNIGLIGDLVAIDETTASRLVSSTVKHLKTQGADIIRCWIVPTDSIYKTVRKQGFVQRESPYSLLAGTHSSDLLIESMTDPADWYISLSDSDGL